LVVEFDATPAELAVLEEGLRSLDMASDLEAAVRREGVTTIDRYGGARPHPGIDLALKCRTQWARTVAQLGVRMVEPSPVRVLAQDEASAITTAIKR